MANVYKIAVALTMTSNAPAFLSVLGKQITGVHANVKGLEGSIRSLSATLGGVAIGLSVGLAKGLKDIADHAKELTHQLSGLQNLNIPDSQIAKIDKLARATALAQKGASESSNLAIANQTYSMFGFDGTMKLMPLLAKFGFVQGAIRGDFEAGENDTFKLLRSADLMGKLSDEKTGQADPDKMAAFLNLVSKMEAATHNTVGVDQFLAVAQQGGPALANMSDQGIISMMIASQGMGGFRAGTALTSLYQQMIGGKMTEPVAEELKNLGLVGKYHIQRGGHVRFDKGGLDTPFAEAITKDPILATQIMQAAMKASGKETPLDQSKELFQIFGRATTERLMSDFLRNLMQQIAERGRIGDAKDLDGQNKTYGDKDIGANEFAVSQAYNNFMEAIAGPNSKNYIFVLNGLTQAINKVSAAVYKMDPKQLAAIGMGLAALSAALTAGGIASIALAIGPAGWFVGGVAALGVALAYVKPDIFKKIAKGILDIGEGLANLDFKTVVSGIVKIFDAQFIQIPNLVMGAIDDAILRLAAQIGSAFESLLGKTWATPQAPGGYGGKNAPFHKSSFSGSSGVPSIHALNDKQATAIHKMAAASSASVPKKMAMVTVPVQIEMKVDGKTLSKIVTKRQTQLAEMPLGVHGGPDGYGSFVGPGTTFQSA